jgi:hypothetical protein
MLELSLAVVFLACVKLEDGLERVGRAVLAKVELTSHGRDLLSRAALRLKTSLVEAAAGDFALAVDAGWTKENS